MVFKDRVEAGRLLAKALHKYSGSAALVLAIPRGGVIVGYEVAKELRCELDIITPRKLKDKYNPELAVGAVMHDGSAYLNHEIIAVRGLDKDYLYEEKKNELQESKRRIHEYRNGRKYPKISRRMVILVDDGIATGATIIAASRYLRSRNAGKVVIAAPVIPNEMLPILKAEADEIIYLEAPGVLWAIGQFYAEFGQVSDSKVIEILNMYWNRHTIRKK